MIVFDCAVCRRKLSAMPTQAGAWVLCPNCRTKLQVPTFTAELVGAAVEPGPHDAAASALASMVPPTPQRPAAIGGFRPGASSGKRYGFNCGYCSSRLEATESMAAQDGQCPTCGNSITIPIQDRYGRLIDPKTRQIIKQDPHPVHAYAAAGERAPGIFRGPDGKHFIKCPRCSSTSPISANNCKSCGMPFTMEGTTLEAAGTSNGFCVASLVLGIIGLVAGCAILPPVLAIIFGIIGYNQLKSSGVEGGGRGMATAGIICGSIGLIWGLLYDFAR